MENTNTKPIIDINDKYRTGNSSYTDDEYDSLKEYTDSKSDTIFNDNVVSPELKLPIHMGSTNKIKHGEVNSLCNWKSKYASDISNNFYVISEKLDGVSLLIHKYNNKFSLYTHQKDVSHLYLYLNIDLSALDDGVYRCELIISKNNFIKLQESYKEESFTDGRSFVAGLMHKKHICDRYKDKIKLLDLVFFESYPNLDIDFDTYKNKPLLNQSKQLEYIKNNNLKYPNYIITDKDKLNMIDLSIILDDMIEKSNYEIDGIVINHDIPYKITEKDNPKHTFAYKKHKQENIATVTVDYIAWQINKDGKYTPVVKFNETMISNHKSSSVTGHNAKKIKEEGIGPGAIIQIIRSGDVIPKIHKVIKKSNNIIYPNNSNETQANKGWHWDKNNVEIMSDEDTRESKIKRVLYFIKHINIKNIGQSFVERFYNIYDTCDINILALLNASVDDFMKLPGVASKMANKAYTEINLKFRNTTVTSLLTAIQIFGDGFSERKIQLITASYIDILTDKNITDDDLKQKLLKIKGISCISADKIISQRTNIYQKYHEYVLHKSRIANNINNNTNNNTNNTTNNTDNTNNNNISNNTNNNTIDNTSDNTIDLDSYIVMFSGIRDKELEENIVSRNGKVSINIPKIINNDKTILITKDINPIKKTQKFVYAEEHNINIMTVDMFKRTFKI
jgi:DNA ligase (NAD+)